MTTIMSATEGHFPMQIRIGSEFVEIAIAHHDATLIFSLTTSCTAHFEIYFGSTKFWTGDQVISTAFDS